MLILLLLLIFIRPFISSLAYPYANFLYMSLSTVLVSSWIIFRRKKISINNQVAAALVLFLLNVVLSMLFSYDKLSAIQGAGNYLVGILFFFFAASLEDRERKLLLSFMTLAALVIAVLAIYQYFFGFRHLLEYLARQKNSYDFALDYIGRWRAFFPFVTPNILAVYLGMSLFLSTTQRNKFIYIIPISFALLLTKSLGVFLSLLIAAVIYFLLKGRLKKKHIVILCGLIVICGLIFIVRTNAQKLHQTPSFSTLMRLGYWRDTLQIIKSHPFIGVGPGNFNLLQSRYSHNSYLQICAEVGLIGFLPFIWFLVAGVAGLGKKIKHPPQPHIYLAGTAASCVFLLHNIIDFGFFLPEVSMIWWLIMGLVLGGWSSPRLSSCK
ncbi:MAG: O-antigen ligase family protein [Candidatus Omnitrophica bacterium]|nr:O-antigen ligase family protein [Candidatus Omnitrophota bacterium]